ncbi:hypothetical protein HPG69_018471 [Diceros bicornis minor]|uniref:Uncharacterized protein n=1 Tax=Diceros bicornis minor TaxID=77932 RepID=A0A7J7EQQ5_DICBM|nr:hypothetical protein HPG69_018471 [Diceros bicornis minor]
MTDTTLAFGIRHVLMILVAKSRCTLTESPVVFLSNQAVWTPLCSGTPKCHVSMRIPVCVLHDLYKCLRGDTPLQTSQGSPACPQDQPVSMMCS